MPRVAAILGFSTALLLFCGYLPSVPAQVPAKARSKAAKLDEFGPLGHCDLTARLDNLAIAIETTRGAKAHIISYAPPGVGERFLELLKDYLVNTRGLLPGRIKTIYGGRNTDLTHPKFELWIVPRNATPPEPQKHETNVETFKGLFADDPAWDHLDIQGEEEMGPGIGRTTDASFADILNQQKNAVGYLVVYSGEDAVPGASKRIAQRQIDYLKGFNLEPGRVNVIFGGHQKETRLQLWILPKDAPPPVRDAGPELPLARTVKAGDFYAYDLGAAKNETNVFTRLKEILSAEKTLRAFLVVKLESPNSNEDLVDEEPEPPDVSETSTSEPVTQPEPADLTKLVEKWRAELANTHKIGADRFIVLFTTAPEFESSHLSLWIVPKGQPLPDPHEEEEPQPQPE